MDNRCIDCGELFSMECLLIGHYRNDHGLEIEEEELFFNDDESFTDWKEEMEVEDRTWSNFSKAGTRRTKKYAAIDQFVCHRRGFYLPRETAKRTKKGSKKINGVCPAKILRFINSDGSSKVSHVKTHLGHPLNFQKLAHVPHPSEAIDNVVNEIFPNCFSKLEETQKMHLLSAEDVRNRMAKQSLRNANQAEAGCEPSASMEEIQEICVSSWPDIHDPIDYRQDVVFYKKENEPHPGLEDEDFVLVLMNEEQRRVLEEFGSDLIILDSTYDIDKTAFSLHTLCVVDDYKEGYPCAFLITNRAVRSISDIFFSCVKGRLGRTMSTDVLISDNMEYSMFYYSWCDIMEQQPRFYFLRRWRIRNEWFANLSKVKNVEKRKKIASILERLRVETDCEKFEDEISKFLMSDDTDLCEFLDYFFINYYESKAQWAKCYRSYTGISTNVILGRFRGIVERHFRDGITSKNIAKLTADLDVYVEERHRESQQNEVYGKLTNKMRLLRRSHKIAETQLINQKPVLLERINITSWKISSFTNPEETYRIVKGRTCDSCKIVCCDCCKDLCAHSLRCSCIENSIKDIMCEHIHYLLLKTPFELIENSLFNIEEVRLQTVNEPALPFSEEARENIICSIQEEYSQIAAKATNEEQLRFLWDELKKINARMNPIETPATVESKFYVCK